MNLFPFPLLALLMQPAPGLSSWLPDTLEKYPACSAVETYAGRKLFDYMDGGAEVYLAYGFSELAVRTYQAGDRKLTVEIYRMDSELGAFGIFSQVEGRRLDVGAQAAGETGLLAFFKGTLFVRLLSVPADKAADEQLAASARALSTRLPGESRTPAEVALFPPGFKEGWPRYLPAPDAARTLWLEGEGEILLCPGCRAFVAAYAAGEAELLATRVEFPAPDKAKAAFEGLVRKLGVARGCPCSQQVCGKAADDTFSALRLEGKLLWWVAGAEDQKTALNFLAKFK